MTSTVDTKHPDWLDRKDEWDLMRDSARGETAIKGRGVTYLPMPSGFKAQSDKGLAMYAAYQLRAQFPDIVSPTLAGMVGVIHRNEFQISMPKAMEGIWERATKDGLPLEALHRRVTRELILMGRYGLMVDAPADGGAPYLAGYSTESIINWSDDRDLFVLDESGPARDGFAWVEKKRHLVLRLSGGVYATQAYSDGGSSGEKVVTKQGGGSLDAIPFVVIGAQDLSLSPDDPPLIGVARSARALYQLSADYRWQLFMTGQETLFVLNADAPEAVGAGIVVSLKGPNDGKTPDAKYVGPQGTGIAAHRIAMSDERLAAAQSGARLFDNEAKTAESGDALRLRFTAQTAGLQTIAKASAAGLEKALRHAAVMQNLDPNEVTVLPPAKLIESTLTPSEALDLIKGWQEGGYSYETLYENLQRGEIASTERTFDEERELVDKEDIARQKAANDDLIAAAPPQRIGAAAQ